MTTKQGKTQGKKQGKTQGKKQGARRSYTTKQREAALASVEESGLTAAAREHDIPVKTIWNWARRSGVSTARAPSGNGASASSTKTTASSTKTTASDTKTTANSAKTTASTAKTTANSAKTTASAAKTSQAEALETPPRPAKRRTQRRYTPSEKAAILEHAHAHGPTAASKEFGVSRYSVYEWQRQARRAAEGEGPSPTSGPDPKDVTELRDREILAEWHRHPGLGPSQVRNQLRRRGVKVGVQTVRRVMEDAGYRPPKVERKKHDQRFEAVRPNHLWHLDYVQRYVNRASTFTLILLDDRSRFVVGHGVDDRERADMVIETFEKAVERHGKPEKVIHDKGAAFWSWRGISRFTALLTELGIDQIECKHKEWNGKLEAFNGNLHTELFDVVRFYDVGDMKRHTALALVVSTWARTLNHRPRLDRGGRSRAELYRAADPTPDEVEEARRALEEIVRKQEQSRLTLLARQDPVVRSTLDEAFARLGLADPERHQRAAIGRYALDHVVAGIAIFEGKRAAGTLPEGVDARYLLGIVRNVALEDEGLHVAEALWRGRLAAQDEILVALDRDRERVVDGAEDSLDLTCRLVDRAVASTRKLDRCFWLRALADAIEAQPREDTRAHFRLAARRVHASYSLPHKDRLAAVRRLAAMLRPLG